jgi:hypothetical protein
MPAFLVHVQEPLVGLAQSQTLSPARLTFLISLVILFTLLFVVAYVWMRKPGFGQHGGPQQPAVPPPTLGQSRAGTDPGGEEIVGLVTCEHGHPAKT